MRMPLYIQPEFMVIERYRGMDVVIQDDELKLTSGKDLQKESVEPEWCFVMMDNGMAGWVRYPVREEDPD